MSRPRVSVGVKWAIRYSVAVLLTLSAFMLYAYDRVERRINKQARLVLSQEVNAILAESRTHPDWDAVTRFVQRRIANSDAELDLSVEWLEPDGTRREAWGALSEHDVQPPDAVLLGDDDWHQSDKELGAEYPYLVMVSAAHDGFVQVAISSQRFAESSGHIREVFLLALPVLVLLTSGVGLLLARGSLRPIAQITRTARHIHAANLDERVPTRGSGDELDELAATFNEMIGRLQHSISSLRRFTADAAHQLRTPLAALRSQLEVTLEKARSEQEYRAVLRGLEVEVENLVGAVHAMLRLAESQAGLDPSRRVPVELGPLLENLLDFFEPVAAEHGVELQAVGDLDVRVPGDAAWLHQLFANLVHNAIKYTPEGGRIELEAVRGDADVVLSVRDTGVGISPDEVARIFERFHRVGGSQSQPGAGLGLTIAQEIARAHHGSIEVESQPGEGATFAVRLPLEADAKRD